MREVATGLQWVIARHGETEWNVAGRRQGELDSPLTQRGLSQVEGLAQVAIELGVDGLWTSPLGRARQTAEIVGSRISCEASVDDGLTEIRHGSMAGLTEREILARFPDEWRARKANRASWRFPGGESYEDAQRRVRDAIRRISAAGARRPMLITHEMISRVVVGCLVGRPLASALHG